MPDRPTSRNRPDDDAPSVAHAPLLPDALRAPDVYGHPADDLQVRETLISWIALAGPYAYKLKKPVRFEFLDYSTPALRRAACVTELALNRRWAPDLYLGLSRFVCADGRARFEDAGDDGTPATPGVGAPARAGAPTDDGVEGAPPDADAAGEYAVRMRRFPAGSELDALVQRDATSPAELRAFGADVAAWHDAAPRDPPSAALAAPALSLQAARDNLATLRAPGTPLAPARVDALERWTDSTYAQLAPLLQRRRDDGRVRECHGDLHARNVVRSDGRLVAFDGIDFDPRLRWIDVASDAAFLVMDLHRLARPDLAYAFLDGWLDAGGDHEAAHGLRWWLAYRALVRAKVDALRAAQLAVSAGGHAGGHAGHAGAQAGERHAGERQADERRADERTEAREAWRECERLVALAEDFAWRAPGALFLTVGVSGSGKSWLAARLADALPAVRLRSDVERKRLAGLAPQARSGSALDAGLYDAELTARTYDRLLDGALALAAAGIDVIVDATHLDPERRTAVARATAARGLGHAWLECDAPLDTLRARVSKRQGDPSEATVTVLERQLARRTPLTLAERTRTVRVDTGGDVDVAAVAGALRAAAVRPDGPPRASAPAS